MTSSAKSHEATSCLQAEEPEAATAAVDPKTGKAAAPARPTTSGKGAKAPKADPKAKPVLPVPQALKDAMLAQMRAANGLKALLEVGWHV